MNKTHHDLLTIIGASLNGTTPQLSLPMDWAELYDLFCRGNLAGVTFKCVSSLPEALLPPPEIQARWKTIAFKNGLRQIFSRNQISIFLEKAHTQGLQPVLFKGVTLAALYPDCNMRFSCDADVLISPKERLLAEQIFRDMGYTYDENSSKEHVPVFRITQNGQSMKFELHDCLWEDYEGKQTELLDSLELTQKESFIKDTFVGISSHTLGYTEHLIYQLFHTAKHFAFEGLPLRYLTDITMYINAHNDKIDYSRFWSALKLLKYDTFACALLRICETYFGLIPRIIPAAYKNVTVDDTFLMDLIYAGKVDDTDIENWASTEMITSYFLRQNEAATSKFRRWLDTFFPKADDLKDHFSYAKKHHILLPIAWIHRFINAVHYHIICKRKGFSSTDTLNKANYRISLLSQLNMLETK